MAEAKGSLTQPKKKLVLAATRERGRKEGNAPIFLAAKKKICEKENIFLFLYKVSALKEPLFWLSLSLSLSLALSI